jgi:protein-disulfide isomerase
MFLQNIRVPMALVVLAVLAALFGTTAPASAQSEPATKADLKAIQGELEALRKELKEIRDLLTRPARRQAPQAPVKARVSIDDDPVLGQADAPVTLVEFSDYQCPFCKRFFDTTLPALKAEYIDTGKLRYVFRDFPIDQIHPYARKAAEAAHCAGDQGKYWEMHDLLFQNQRALQTDRLKAHAEGLGGIDMASFEECLTSNKYSAEVQKDFEAGSAAGVRGTPGFFLGKSTPDGTFEGTFIRGAQPVQVFRNAIERLLKEG